MNLHEMKTLLAGTIKAAFANKKTLDKLSESDSGKLLYNGSEIGGAVKLSQEEDNALKELEDGSLFAKDNSEEVQQLTETLSTIKKYQKYVNTELDYGVFEISSGSITVNKAIVFSSVVSGNMELSENGFIKLKKDKTYIIDTNLYNLQYTIGIYLVDISLNKLGEWGSSGHASFIYTPSDDIEVSILSQGSLEKEWSHVNIHEIGRRIVVDPVEHVNTTQGIEDTPIGHIMSYIGIAAPKHYLVCDGAEYFIDDYPHLADHIKNSFGSVNYFGGDGILTFCVPDLKERFLKGSDNSGVYQDAGLPNITANWKSEPSASASGAVYITTEKGTLESVSSGGSSDNRVYFDASLSNPIYGASETVTPDNFSVLYCIKYEPTYYSIVRRYTTEEDILLAEEEVLLLRQQIQQLEQANRDLKHEISLMESIIEAINRTSIKDEPLEEGEE